MRMTTKGVWVVLVGLATACGGEADGDSSDDVVVDPPAGFFDGCGGKIVGADGSIDAAEYLAQATAWSRELIDCRLGPSFADYHPEASGDDRPTLWGPPSMTNPYSANGNGLPYQYGGPPVQSNNIFGSVNAQVLYVPDAEGTPGVDRITTYLWSNNTINQSPVPPWWGTPTCWWPGCASTPDPLGQNPAWEAALGHPVREPVLAKRTYHSWDNDALVIFRGGFIGAAGTETSSSANVFFQFPANKVPTSVALTSLNEFALVTIWDTDTLQGQVAVIALTSGGLVHNWFYMGMPSAGSFSEMKLLGYIDLPDMATPTAIEAAGTNGSGTWPGGLVLGQHPLDSQAGRDEFAPGGPLAGAIALGGYAVVASRWEDKVTFIDLQPLYEAMNAAYLTDQAHFDETQANRGPADDEWPYAFSVAPASAPVVITTLPVEDPTAVLAGRIHGSPIAKAYVSSLGGTVAMFDVSTLATDAPVVAADVQQVATIAVGHNPVNMVWPRNTDPLDDRSGPYTSNDSFVLVSRGDRALEWVTTDATSGHVFRTFTDRRFADPVDLDIGERAYVLTVADFAGKQILNYRFAPLPGDHTESGVPIGMGPDGTAGAEFAGAWPIEGNVFRLSSTNVN